MEFFVKNIEEMTLENINFRTVLVTSPHSQLVLMSLLPKEDIGMEVHNSVDQFVRIERGMGKAVLNNEEFDISDNSAVVIPAGTQHNIINTSSSEAMKLYTIYSPANHPEGTVHKTKQEAAAYEHS